MKNRFFSLAFSLIFIAACTGHFNQPANKANSVASNQHLFNTAPSSVTFAQFNVSFAHDSDPTENYAQWIGYMTLSRQQQDDLIQAWRTQSVTKSDKKLAERVIQIRNVAAIIQSVRPDVLLLNEFNNDGEGNDYAALAGFQTNYLGHAQSANSIDGGNLLAPIFYPFMQNYATNTGLSSELDLNHNGHSVDDPNDAYGFGFYHGHYAFALLSKYEIDTKNTRTFQTFKRKDLPEAVMPVVNVCDGNRELPEGLKCGDNWFSEDVWNNLRLSSKNHVDAPIIIPTKLGNKVIHALMSHPTPPAFDSFSDNNKYRNSEENAFWLHYISAVGKDSEYTGSFIYDDQGSTGGFRGNSFVIMGDLNADAQLRSGKNPKFDGIKRLMANTRVNQLVAQANGQFAPISKGGEQHSKARAHPFPATRSSTFGVRSDYSVPSANLDVIASGVFWRANNESGRLLFNDERIGKRGSDKEISSDHRLVWVSVAPN